MVFVRTDKGCLICITHKVNADGYLRKRWGNPRSGDLHVEMFHRFIFRAHKGDIPEGHEVDHTCKTRACCNADHLEAIPRIEHLVKTNEDRYADRRIAAEAYWRDTGCTGTRLGEVFGVSFSTGCE